MQNGIKAWREALKGNPSFKATGLPSLGKFGKSRAGKKVRFLRASRRNTPLEKAEPETKRRRRKVTHFIVPEACGLERKGEMDGGKAALIYFFNQ